jgi:hypothetical protein
MLVYVATNVGVHLAQNVGLDAVEEEGSHGVYDSLRTTNS